MNRKTLQRVIDAIKEDKKDYAMGILETIMDTLPEEIITTSKSTGIPMAKVNTPSASQSFEIPMPNMANVDLSAIHTE